MKNKIRLRTNEMTIELTTKLALKVKMTTVNDDTVRWGLDSDCELHVILTVSPLYRPN